MSPISPPRPVSLLSAMFHSPPPPPLEPSSSSSSASVPPATTPNDQPASILRRPSVSEKSISAEDNYTAPALKFTVAPPASHLGPPLRPRTDDDVLSDTDTDTSPAAMTVSLSEYPFARPTNYRGRRLSSPRTPDERHVQVAAIPPKKCSRHCSPPPTRSRSGTRAAGPEEGSVSEEEPSSRRRGSLPALFGHSGSVLRRASEHLPGNRPTIEPGTSMSLGATNALFVCPPALDATPAVARSVSPNVDDLTLRLELALSGSSPPISLGSKPVPLLQAPNIVHAEL